MVLLVEGFPGAWNEDALSPHVVEIGDRLRAETCVYSLPEASSLYGQGTEIKNARRVVSGVVSAIVDREHFEGGYFRLEPEVSGTAPTYVTTRPRETPGKIERTFLYRQPQEGQL